MIKEDTVDVEGALTKNKEGIISILEDIQKKEGYLPEQILRNLADETDWSLVDIYGIATFYKYFSLKPRGKHLISVCVGTACHVRGGGVVAEEFEKVLDIKAGDTTKDKLFTLETVNCLGACARGPIVVVDGHYFSNVNKSQVKQIIQKAKEGLDKTDIKTDERIFPIEVRCPHCNHTLMDKGLLIDDFPSIGLTVSYNRKHGRVYLSSLYGSFNIKSDVKISNGTSLDVFCPYCHTELNTKATCPLCDAFMFSMVVQGEGGVIQICSRRGCNNHMMDLLKGLCTNCANLKTCTLKKIGGGVWQCEEFK